MSLFYNVGTQTLDNGLNDIEIASGLDYLIILDAPANANIKIRLNENTAPQIPMKDGWQIETLEVDKIYLSCDAVVGGVITYGQADGNIKIQPNPTINAIEKIAEIESFSPALLASITSALNPYDDPTSVIGGSTSTSVVTLLDITADFDKLVFSGAITYSGSFGNYTGWTGIGLLIDNEPVFGVSGGIVKGNSGNSTFENIRGKNIKVIHNGNSTSSRGGYILQKFNKKV